MTVRKIKSIGDVPYPIDDVSDAFSPLLTAGAALGITGNDAEESAWLTRTSDADGVVTIRSIHGNTIVQDGELVSVQMEGIESTGFNQLNLASPKFGSNYNKAVGNVLSNSPSATVSGENPCILTAGAAWNGVTYVVEVLSGQIYHFHSTFTTGTSSNTKVTEYLLDAEFKVVRRLGNYGQNNTLNHNITVQDGERYFAISYSLSQADTMTLTDTILNVSDPVRNGTYEPYWHQERLIPAGTLRGAGSVYDELTETERITRIGERAYQSGDESDATIVTDGTVTHYPLATPTTTPIDPPLNLTYRTEQGGTERVIVPTGELSAPPTIVTAQGYTAESLRDAALATIAPVENGLASTNYGVGAYLVHGGQLCKVTTAIATGEAITIGTNVTATTVMAEVIALIAQ